MIPLRIPITVLAFRRIFEVMGLICKNYQADTENEVVKVEEMLLHCLETQVFFFVLEKLNRK
jgi:hypothetical protein